VLSARGSERYAEPWGGARDDKPDSGQECPRGILRRGACHSQGGTAQKTRKYRGLGQVREGAMWRRLKRVLRALIPEGVRQEAHRLLTVIYAQSEQLLSVQRDVAELALGLSQTKAELALGISQTKAELALELSQTKAGVSAIQGQSNESFTHIIVLRQELAEMSKALSTMQSLALELVQTKAGVSSLQGQTGEALSHIVELHAWALPLLLDLAARDQLQKASALEAEICREEHQGLAVHYARMADLVSRYWIRRQEPPQDVFPADDFSIQFAKQSGIEVPNAYVAEVRPLLLPWRHLWSDPECGIFLIVGQSMGGDDSQFSHLGDGDVFVFDFLRMHCLQPTDFPSGAGNRAFWDKLGNSLISKGVFRRVLIISLDATEPVASDWIPGGTMHRLASLAFSRLRKELGTASLPFSAVLWQQGEADAAHTDISALAYKMHFRDAIADLRANGVFAPVFAAISTLGSCSGDSSGNRDAVRSALLSLPDPSCGIFSGPDLDSEAVWAPDVAAKSAELWLSALADRRGLLDRPAHHLSRCVQL
jgi:hypothetical protein